eukprot:764205-Hanusia_phi.AAC.3
MESVHDTYRPPCRGFSTKKSTVKYEKPASNNHIASRRTERILTLPWHERTIKGMKQTNVTS